MKRWFSLSLSLLMLFCFSAAYAQSEQPSWPEYDGIVNMPASTIMSIQFSFSTEGGVQEATVTDSKTIEGVCALIQVLSITAETDTGVLDDGLTVAVNTADGTQTRTLYNAEDETQQLETLREGSGGLLSMQYTTLNWN